MADPFAEDDNPFAGNDGDDDYNPFDDSMFEKNPAAPPAAAVAPPPAPVSKDVPDWAAAEDKTDFVAEVKAAPPAAPAQRPSSPAVSPTNYGATMSPESVDDNVPDWARETAGPVKGAHYGGADQAKEPLLGAGTSGGATTPLTSGHQYVGVPEAGAGGFCLPTKPYDAARVNNWPPFPKRCPWPFRPCFYQYFGEPEIPAIWRVSLKGMFSLWCAYEVALFWNLIARLAALDCKTCDNTVSGMFLALGFFLVLGPCAYYWWFRTLYNAARSDSTLKYGCFFCTFSIQIALCIFFAIGPPNMGAAGIWTASLAVQDNQEVSFMMFAAAIVWVLLSIANIIGVQKVLMTFRTSGLSENAVQRAQQEAAAGAGSVAVQVAQTDAGRQALISAASNA